jgi:drug/metabolite transporter (DMT)-like permease
MLLACATMVLWATLPVALKVALERVDPITLTWARFTFATAAVGGWLGLRGELGAYTRLSGGAWGVMAIAAVMLIGNYVLYLVGLQLTTPANTQMLIQAAPLLMALGGIWVFRERFNRWQWLGLAAVAAGLLLFSGDQLVKPPPPGARYVLGSTLVGLAALMWAVYALAQKQLLTQLSSTPILGFIYLVATIGLLPLSAPAKLFELGGLHSAALVYSALNTVASYGAFAEALAHWEASRVGVVLALTPLLAVAIVQATHAVAPDLVRSEQIAWTGWLGAVLIVVGSALSGLMRDAFPEERRGRGG